MATFQFVGYASGIASNATVIKRRRNVSATLNEFVQTKGALQQNIVNPNGNQRSDGASAIQID